MIGSKRPITTGFRKMMVPSHSISETASGSGIGGQLSVNISKILTEAKSQGTYKYERILQSAQSNVINVEGSTQHIINLCSNNYLGFANHKLIQEAAINAMKNRGFGLASGRIICGTQDLHKQLERELAEFHSMEDCLLYTSCFDANAGIFEALLTENDRIFSDALNHASIIDGVRKI
jgi:7-keto-8-aminopelargonate synthetase-like enzyme